MLTIARLISDKGSSKSLRRIERSILKKCKLVLLCELIGPRFARILIAHRHYHKSLFLLLWRTLRELPFHPSSLPLVVHGLQWLDNPTFSLFPSIFRGPVRNFLDHLKLFCRNSFNKSISFQSSFSNGFLIEHVFLFYSICLYF